MIVYLYLEIFYLKAMIMRNLLWFLFPRKNLLLKIRFQFCPDHQCKNQKVNHKTNNMCDIVKTNILFIKAE